MITIQLPTAQSNAALKDGRLPKIIQETLERLQPESAYFFVRDGRRTAQLVVDLASSADMSAIGERFFTELEAELTFLPVMNPAELKEGLGRFMAG